MSMRGDRYSGPATRRNCVLAAVLFATVFPLGGCSSVGPFAELDRRQNLAAPGGGARVVKTSLSNTDTVALSDWETVRQTIATAPVDNHGRYGWSNPDTGSTGSVTVLALTEESESCRPFATTVNDVRGIRHYRGDACRGANGLWRLVDLAADDAKLL